MATAAPIGMSGANAAKARLGSGSMNDATAMTVAARAAAYTNHVS